MDYDEIRTFPKIESIKTRGTEFPELGRKMAKMVNESEKQYNNFDKIQYDKNNNFLVMMKEEQKRFEEFIKRQKAEKRTLRLKEEKLKQEKLKEERSKSKKEKTSEERPLIKKKIEQNKRKVLNIKLTKPANKSSSTQIKEETQKETNESVNISTEINLPVNKRRNILNDQKHQFSEVSSLYNSQNVNMSTTNSGRVKTLPNISLSNSSLNEPLSSEIIYNLNIINRSCNLNGVNFKKDFKLKAKQLKKAKVNLFKKNNIETKKDESLEEDPVKILKEKKEKTEDLQTELTQNKQIFKESRCVEKLSDEMAYHAEKTVHSFLTIAKKNPYFLKENYFDYQKSKEQRKIKLKQLKDSYQGNTFLLKNSCLKSTEFLENYRKANK